MPFLQIQDDGLNISSKIEYTTMLQNTFVHNGVGVDNNF